MKSILFIEDESHLQKTFRDLLEDEGYEMITALNGEEGLKLAKSKEPDLILLDLILPKLDGFEVLEKLKKNEGTKDIPIIILTNLEQMENIEKALKLGAKNYLVKADYELEEVLEKIERTLS